MSEEGQILNRTNTPDWFKAGSLEGFYLWYMRNDPDKRFKFVIARLAREYPDEDPREVLLEHLSERIYKYEQYRKRLRRGQATGKAKLKGLRTEESALLAVADRLKREREAKEAKLNAQKSSQEGGHSNPVSQSRKRVFKVSHQFGVGL